MRLNTFFLLSIVLVLNACTQRHSEIPVLIEVVDAGYRISEKSFADFCSHHLSDTSHVFQWENHRLIYTAEEDAPNVKKELEAKFPDLIVKLYTKPLYVFDIEKQCGKKKAKNITDIVFTANLVADTIKQHEYLNYHARQSVDWPEVAQGFCRADFQQLLVYLSGRQLMLVIRIPANKTLDELNPETVKNNPRMVEWNRRMAAYQEGIEQAPEGTVWVQLNKINVQ